MECQLQDISSKLALQIAGTRRAAEFSSETLIAAGQWRKLFWTIARQLRQQAPLVEEPGRQFRIALQNLFVDMLPDHLDAVEVVTEHKRLEPRLESAASTSVLSLISQPIYQSVIIKLKTAANERATPLESVPIGGAADPIVYWQRETAEFPTASDWFQEVCRGFKDPLFNSASETLTRADYVRVMSQKISAVAFALAEEAANGLSDSLLRVGEELATLGDGQDQVTRQQLAQLDELLGQLRSFVNHLQTSSVSA